MKVDKASIEDIEEIENISDKTNNINLGENLIVKSSKSILKIEVYKENILFNLIYKFS